MLAVSSSTHASMITTSSGGLFDDLGTSTVDRQTGLEWLDVTMTAGRSFDDVFADINSSEGVFESGSWRFATARDVEALGFNWFGVDVSETIFTFLSGDAASDLSGFIQTFGDTLKFYYDTVGDTSLTFDNSSAGYTFGLIDSTELFSDSPFPTRSAGMFLDENFIVTSTGQVSNGPDLLSAQSTAIGTDTGYLDIGSFLVRDYQVESAGERVTSVSEPSTLAVMMAALFGIGYFRKKHSKA